MSEGRVLRVSVLGPLRAWRDDVELDLGPPARRAVLGLLLLAGGAYVSRSEMVDALWGDRPPATAANVLQTHVKHLRRLLEPGRRARARGEVLRYANGGYTIVPGTVESDLDVFRRRLGMADDAERDGAVDRVATALADGLTRWHGRPLADIPTLATHPKVETLVAERRRTLIRYGEAMIALGAAAEAVAMLGEAAAEQPLDERLQATLINATRAAGQRVAAFEIYAAVRRRLADELGVGPGPELAAAHLALLRDEPDVEVTGAEPADLVVPAQLPADIGLSGRAGPIRELDGILAAGGPVPIVVISGCAGVGKTALAVHWAHRVRHRFPDGQLYANLGGRGATVRPIRILAAFLFSLGIPAERVPVDVATAGALLRTTLAGRRVLIVLDNAGDADQVRPLLPGNQDSMVVVTSRERMVGLVARDGARQLTLDVLCRTAALDLLGRTLGHERVDADRAAAVELAALCAFLPLALRIAAARLADHPHCTIADHVEELRLGDALSALEVSGDEQAAVRVAFDQSYGALSALGQRLFRLLGLVPVAAVSVRTAAVLAGISAAQAARELSNLARAHLVQQRGADRYGLFHHLHRQYAVEQTPVRDREPERRAAVNRLRAWHLGGAGERAQHPHNIERLGMASLSTNSS